ncbi:hypothetical protein MHM84_20080 [Halomonas sp. McH1-25]|uniref:hypothetical protein n=1 Tax=unclassified Halomonas TaxID=2609666 RepID=UPI001EF45A31|nr:MULTISPECIES: hypothetical protein [unclassified Halomonas]MCG7602046.1 hypothetical protein [Halomonas sp. McH1-25]MCP1342882.1 hypothetical protein [Halomonas sp. FL8]MCP1361679.1 hypothetical protein [Halomonas sp. BBD45]MCP1363624.1 hypothetical protein [Halomonas sp. BBD48]
MNKIRMYPGEATIVGTSSSSMTATVHRSAEDVQLDEHGRVKRASAKAFFAAARRSDEEARQFISRQREELLKRS